MYFYIIKSNLESPFYQEFFLKKGPSTILRHNFNGLHNIIARRTAKYESFAHNMLHFFT